MKNLILALIAVLTFASCSREPFHEIQYSNNGEDSVVYVHYYDQNSGQWVDRYMEYIIFMNLYNMGGYNGVYGYYRTNPYDPYRYSRYHDYSYHYSPHYYKNNGYTRSSDGKSWVAPPRRYSSPNHSHNSTWSNSSNRGSSSPSFKSNSSTMKSTGRSSPSSRPSSSGRSSPSHSSSGHSSPSHSSHR